jgi:putative membrane protein
MQKHILAASLLSVGLALAMPAEAAPARQFLREAIMGDTAEVQMGQLIQQRAASAQVKDFGATLERDHAMARDKASALAKRMGLAVPTGVKPDAKAEMAKLQRLSGGNFDREVARFAVIEHRKDIAKFEAQARNGDRLTREHARETLPHLRHHLTMAQALR